MRHTPLDGPDSGSREGETRTDGTPQDDVGGVVDRLRSVLGRVTDVVSGIVGHSGDRDRDRPAELPSRVDVGETVSRDDQEPAGDRPVVLEHGGNEGLSDRPGGDRPDRPELVARWHDGRLTLSEPNETGAQISSDVWSEVDH